MTVFLRRRGAIEEEDYLRRQFHTANFPRRPFTDPKWNLLFLYVCIGVCKVFGLPVIN